MLSFEKIRKNGDLLFESIRGSHLFGLNTETSDIDTFGVFIGPIDWFIGSGKDKLSMVKSEKNDDYWDELGKYFKELGESNPEALVSLFTPEKHIKYFSPLLQPLWDIKDSLITKKCFKPFVGYAVSQIKKAKGLKKAINIDPSQVKERKTPLDFCQVPVGIGTWTLTKWLRDNGLKQEYCGVSRLPNTVESYALFYDWGADKNISLDTFLKLYVKNYESWELDKYKQMYNTVLTSGKPIGYRGILDKDDRLTSQIRLSSIPISERDEPICYFQFNSGAYSQHCVDYKRYWEWVNNRNEQRFQLNKGYDFDAKNMSTCVRILTMAKEMAQGKGMLLDRTNIDRDWLLKIKNHGVTYDEIMRYVENLEENMQEEFEKSSLPDEPDIDLLEKIMLNIRYKHYKINK